MRRFPPVLGRALALLRGPKPSVLRHAEAARARLDWGGAARLYAAYLAVHPGKWRVRVQLGHMLKEAGRLSEAETAYLEAEQAAPADANLQLQLGHLKKLQGALLEARDRYARALALDPGNENAARELFALGFGSDAAPGAALPPPRIDSGVFLDVSDIVIFFQGDRHVTGIQRVVVELLRRFRKDRPDFRYVSNYPYNRALLLPAERLHAVLDALERPEVDQRALARMIREMLRAAVPVEAAPGSTIVILGAFWIFPAALPGLLDARRRGVAVGVLVYDLIPLLHPEFCAPGNVQNFTHNFTFLANIASFMLTISDATGRDVRSFFERIGATAPVETTPLADRFEAPPVTSADRAWLDSQGLDRPFALCVGSIEVRKNHLLLFHLWRRLHRAHGDALPPLVLVGKRGWLVSDFLNQLEATRRVSGKIRVLTDVSNARLSALYERCLFTVFPSFMEGWGLPVGESLAFGKPCAASGTGSIPEVGGDLAEYFDPYSLADAERVVSRLLFDEGHRAARVERIAREFRPRPWSASAARFAEAVERLSAATSVWEPTPALDPGRLYRLGKRWVDHTDVATLAERRAELACAEGWRLEREAVWSEASWGEIAFRTPEDAGVVAVILWLAPQGEGPVGPVSATTTDGSRAAPFGGTSALRLVARAEARVVRIRLEAAAGRIGLAGFGWSPETDDAMAADLAAQVARAEQDRDHDPDILF